MKRDSVKLNILSSDSTNLIDSNKTITKLSTVVKELIENSLDAGAQNISVFIKEGGLSLIEVKDDGCGICKDDFETLCLRFTSSKLSSYDDIYNINTFGFRGEALSILSYISHLSIISRTEDSQVGKSAVFKNGKLSEGSLKAVTCEIGTVIKVENIFYNNLIRKNYYDKNEEAKEIISLVSKYAFQFHLINFNLSNNTFSNKILSSSSVERKAEILLIKRSLCSKLFNAEIQDNLFRMDNYSQSSSHQDINNINLKCDINFECYFTKPSANLDKSSLILFLNNRLIVNTNVKKVIDQIYSKFLIKNGNYFVFLSMECRPGLIDVNVKANKSEVIFEDEDKFLMSLKVLLEEELNNEINSKNYYMGEYSNFSEFKKRDKDILYQPDNVSYYAKDKVRVDTKTATLERYLVNRESGVKSATPESVSNQLHDVTRQTILKELFNSDSQNFHFTDIIKNHFYVGYESKNSLIFIQYKTSLYVVNTELLLQEYFLFLILKREDLTSLKIRSEYTIENIIAFNEENCVNDDGRLSLKGIRRDLDKILFNLKSKLHLLESLSITLSKETLQIEEISLVNLFVGNVQSSSDSDDRPFLNDQNSFKRNFLCYIPLFYYSILQFISQNDKADNHSNECFNFIIEIAKIHCHYLSCYYMEILSKVTTEEANSFLRDCLMFNIKKEKDFYIRRNLKEENILEKIVDTETLYTVFERC